MGIFTDIVSSGTDNQTPGNESAGGLDSQHANYLNASIAAAEATSEIALGATEGQQISHQLDFLVEGIDRIDDALAFIAGSAIGFDAKPSLGAETLAAIDATILNEFKVKCTGLESDSDVGPVKATEEVQLGLESKAGDAFQSFKETIYKFLDWVTEQFKNIFGGYERQKAKAEAVKAKEEKFEGSQSKDKLNVKFAMLVKGKEGTTVSNSLEADLKALGEAVTKDIVDLEGDLSEVVDAVGESIDSPIADWSEEVGDRKYKLPKAVVDAYAKALTKAKEFSGDVIGNRTYKTIVGADTADGVGKLKVTLEAPTKAPANKEVAPLERAKIGDLMDEVIDVCESLIATRSKILDGKKFKSTFEKVTTQAEKLSKDDEFKTIASSVKLAAKIAAQTGMMANGGVRQPLAAHLYSVIDEVVKYADKSLKAA